jgi:hypothetical protein
MMRREDLPEGTELCPVCRSRGSNFDRHTLELKRCEESEGQGFVVDWNQTGIEKLTGE